MFYLAEIKAVRILAENIIFHAFNSGLRYLLQNSEHDVSLTIMRFGCVYMKPNEDK